MAPACSTRPNVFISYSHSDKDWLTRLQRHLKPIFRQERLACWDDTHIRPGDDWKKELRTALNTAQVAVLLISADFFASDFIDETELPPLLLAAEEKGVRILPVILSASRFARNRSLARFQAVNSPDRPLDGMPPPEQEQMLDRLAQIIEGAFTPSENETNQNVAISAPGPHRRTASPAAAESMHSLDEPSGFILPDAHLFRYEKDIVRAYMDGGGTFSPELTRLGCPRKWPIARKLPAMIPNPVPESTGGSYRAEGASVRVDARQLIDSATPFLRDMVFPEAGPRALLHLHSGVNPLKAAVVVSGGVAPGTNAVLDGIVKRHLLYEKELRRSRGFEFHEVQLVGYQEGFKALTRAGQRQIDLKTVETDRLATQAGSLLTTSRADELLDSEDGRAKKLDAAADRLAGDGINILYVVGGGGSMRAAFAIANVFRIRHPGRELIVVGLPKSTDNDILWAWESFGFRSAVARARELVIDLHAEAVSNPRLAVIQLFGSGSGQVVSHAALGSRICDIVLIPEMQFSMRGLFDYTMAKLSESLNKTHRHGAHGTILMAETALPTDASEYIEAKHVALNPEEKESIRNFGNCSPCPCQHLPASFG